MYDKMEKTGHENFFQFVIDPPPQYFVSLKFSVMCVCIATDDTETELTIKTNPYE